MQISTTKRQILTWKSKNTLQHCLRSSLLSNWRALLWLLILVGLPLYLSSWSLIKSAQNIKKNPLWNLNPHYTKTFQCHLWVSLQSKYKCQCTKKILGLNGLGSHWRTWSLQRRTSRASVEQSGSYRSCVVGPQMMCTICSVLCIVVICHTSPFVNAWIGVRYASSITGPSSSCFCCMPASFCRN